MLFLRGRSSPNSIISCFALLTQSTSASCRSPHPNNKSTGMSWIKVDFDLSRGATARSLAVDSIAHPGRHLAGESLVPNSPLAGHGVRGAVLKPAHRPASPMIRYLRGTILPGGSLRDKLVPQAKRTARDEFACAIPGSDSGAKSTVDPPRTVGVVTTNLQVERKDFFSAFEPHSVTAVDCDPDRKR